MGDELLEVGSWKLEIGCWRLDVGGWMFEVRGSKLGNSKSEFNGSPGRFATIYFLFCLRHEQLCAYYSGGTSMFEATNIEPLQRSRSDKPRTSNILFREIILQEHFVQGSCIQFHLLQIE